MGIDLNCVPPKKIDDICGTQFIQLGISQPIGHYRYQNWVPLQKNRLFTRYVGYWIQ